MAGTIVTDLTLCQAPNNNNKCPDNSDLPGVYVMDPQTQCEIAYDICDASTPLGQALGLGAADTVEVADGTLCFLSVPEAVQLFECEAEDTLGAGALVTDQQLCNALVQEVAQCEDGPLQGVFVSPEDAATTCTLEDVVTNCPISVDNPMSGQLVTTVLLCNAPVDAEKCPAQNDDGSATDLPGVYTMMPSQCNIDYPVCDSTTPLGIALDLGVTEEVEVVDDALCQLAVPQPMECTESGFLVNDPQNCPTKCPDGTYIMQGMDCPSNGNGGQDQTTLTVSKINDPITCLDEDAIQINGTGECEFVSTLPFYADFDEPSDYEIIINDNDLSPIEFAGSSGGVESELEPGAFSVTEDEAANIDPIGCTELSIDNDNGAELFGGCFNSDGTTNPAEGPINCVNDGAIFVDVDLCIEFNESCDENILEGQQLSCQIENTIVVTSDFDD